MSETRNEAGVELMPPDAARRFGPGRSYGLSRSQRRASQRLVLAVALSIALLALFLVTVFSVARINGLNRDNGSLRAELALSKQEQGQTTAELARTKKALAGITKGRLPYLRDLVPDKVIVINQGYIKNIVFSVLNHNGKRRYEYKLVMENRTRLTVHPEARIFVFDKFGVQVGTSEISAQADLAPGESRSQSSVIDRFIAEKPHYFYVSTLPGAKTGS